MGSGTVGVACKLYGCDYVGIDISQSYIEMANQRINDYETFRERYEKEIDKHVITGMTYQERKNKKKQSEE